MKNVIVTGANGFIASALIYKLLSRGVERVYAVVRDSSKVLQLPHDVRVHPVVLPMEEYGSLCKLIPMGADTFFSLAWAGTRGEMRMNEQIQKSNFCNILKAVDCAVSLGCRNLVLAGSQAEYGGSSDGSVLMITEDMLSEPSCFYGEYKLRLWQQVSEIYSSDIVAVKEPRLFSVYGAGDYRGSFVSRMYESLRSNRDFFVNEPCRLWDFLFVSDCAEALCIVASECSSGIYNVVSGDCRPLLSFAQEMRRALESSGSVNFAPGTYTDPYGCCLSGDKLKKYGFNAEFTFSHGVLELQSASKI